MNTPVRQPTLRLTPVHAALRANAQSTIADLVVRLDVPEQPNAATRPSFNLALAIDASHSMDRKTPSGMSLLDAAKRAALAMLDRLAPTDRLAVVVYGEQVRVLMPSMRVSEARQVLPERLAGVGLMGNTALHKGWLTAANEVAPQVSQFGVSRVLLLSDGQANQGVTSIEQIVAEATQLASSGIGTSTYGLGDQFNEALMTAMARDGQAFYAQEADALIPYFETELGLLGATAGRQVRLQISVQDAQGQALVLKNLNDHPHTEAGWSMPSLVAGAEAWAAFEVAVPAVVAKTALTLRATVEWVDADGQAHTQSLEQAWPVVGPKKTIATDDWAAERVKEARAAQMQRQALAEAARGNWQGVHTAINNIQAMAGSNAYLGGVSATLSALADAQDLTRFSKEATYSSYTMSNRVTRSNEAADRLEDDGLGLRKVVQGSAAAPVPPVGSQP